MMMTKVKTPPEDLIYDIDHFFLRAACVCVRDETEAEVLLVSSPGKPGRWIVPGGKIQVRRGPVREVMRSSLGWENNIFLSPFVFMQANEKAEASAMREAVEEAGAVGQLGRCLGVYDNAERKHRTTVFVLRSVRIIKNVSRESKFATASKIFMNRL